MSKRNGMCLVIKTALVQGWLDRAQVSVRPRTPQQALTWTPLVPHQNFLLLEILCSGIQSGSAQGQGHGGLESDAEKQN